MTDKIRIFVFYHYGQGAHLWPQYLKEGRVRDPSPYGYAYVESEAAFTFSQDHEEGVLYRNLRRSLKYLLGFDLLHAFRNRRAMSDADVIWTHTEKEHLAVAALKILGILPRSLPVLANSVWLWADFEAASSPRKALLKLLLATHAVHSVESRQGAEIGTRILGKEVVLIPFGIEPLRSSAAARRKRPLILAPGNDRDRDWDLLGNVARRRPDWDFLVLSRRRRARRLSFLPNVEVRSSGQAGMEPEFAVASAIVILCQENPHASGATTVLQALTCERPVVVTDVGGIDMYGGAFALYAKIGDAADVENQLQAALDRAADATAMSEARRSVEDRGFDERTYARRHLLVTRDLLAGRSIRATVSELRRLDAEE